MNKSNTFKRVTAQDNNEYICPLELTQKKQPLSIEQLDDCVEADVVGRYIGNLKMVEDNG
jgi:hypothetical protein